MSTAEAKPDVKPAIDLQPPEPEERMEFQPGLDNHNIWALKIPRFLLERWQEVQEAGVELGTLMVDSSSNPPKISLRLPQPASQAESSQSSEPYRPKFDSTNLPSTFSVVVPEERAKNTWIFTEKPIAWGPSNGVSMGKRKREPAHPKLLARVAHECTATAVEDENLRKLRKQRRLDQEQGRRPIEWLENTGMSKGELNQFASGYSNVNSSFGKNMVLKVVKNAKGERNARLERTELMDRLFSLFAEKPYWNFATFRETLKQPDEWLREVLKGIAAQETEGQYKNMWRLKPEFRVSAIQGEKSERKPIVGAEEAGGEDDGEEEEEEDDDDDDEDDEEDDDDDMEEVLS